MESQVSNGDAAVPQIVITEPSPIIQNTSVVSIAEKAGPITAATSSEATHPIQNAKPQQDQSASEQVQPEASGTSSGEFTSAQECAECLVSVPEPVSESVEEATTATSETDHDDFRTTSTSAGCCSFFVACLLTYERMWEVLDNRCRLPFWMILMAVPISAGVMGSLYMFSCPAASTLSSTIFTIGISLMAVLTIRVCIVLHRMAYNEAATRHTLQTLLLITTFITVMFFITESVLFWQMDSDPHPESAKFCDPTFVTYAFWWNCVMWFVMVVLTVSPA